MGVVGKRNVTIIRLGVLPLQSQEYLQGTINCASLLARVGGSGELERKFVEICGTLRKFEEFEEF